MPENTMETRAMLTINSDEKLDETLGRYLINVLNIPQMWEEKKTLKQKDAERKKLHDKLVELLNIEDREIISKCTEATWPVYVKFGELRKAKNAFYHEFNKLTGQNPMSSEQEAKLDEFYNSLNEGSKSRKQLVKNFRECCKTVREQYYKGILKKYQEEYGKKSPEELSEMLKAVPEKYLKYYEEMDRRSHDWFTWFNQSNYEYGNGFSSSYYDMRAYYLCEMFYHECSRRVAIAKDGIRKMKSNKNWYKNKEAVDWTVKALATFQTWFDGVEEYLNTPYEKLVEIYLSFKEKKEK